jgi:hypothetical protein
MRGISYLHTPFFNLRDDYRIYDPKLNDAVTHLRKQYDKITSIQDNPKPHMERDRLRHNIRLIFDAYYQDTNTFDYLFLMTREELTEKIHALGIRLDDLCFTKYERMERLLGEHKLAATQELDDITFYKHAVTVVLDNIIEQKRQLELTDSETTLAKLITTYRLQGGSLIKTSRLFLTSREYAIHRLRCQAKKNSSGASYKTLKYYGLARL